MIVLRVLGGFLGVPGFLMLALAGYFTYRVYIDHALLDCYILKNPDGSGTYVMMWWVIAGLAVGGLLLLVLALWSLLAESRRSAAEGSDCREM